MSLKPGKYDGAKPDIELLDFKSKKRYGLKLDGNGLQVGTVSQDDSVLIRSAGKRIGDFDEQRSWKGGRGIENLASNAEGFWDSDNAWTLSAGRVHQTLLFRFARGLRSADISQPNPTSSVLWKTLLGSERYQSTSFVSRGVTADYARLWIRRVGKPGTLTVELRTNSAGSPSSTVLKSATVTTTTDIVSVLQLFEWAGTTALVATTTYHVVIYGDAADTSVNHWDVGVFSGGTGKSSSDGSSWNASTFAPFYYIMDADLKRTFFTFFLDSAMYLVSKNDDGSASKLYINGDRGKATSGTASSLTDTGKSWDTSLINWEGATVKIIRGTGAGQIRNITSMTSNSVSVSPNWTTNPSTDSEYIIYGTGFFTELTSTGLGAVTSAPAVVNQIVYFPQGSGTNIRRMIWNAATPGHSYSDDGTNKASFLTTVASGGVTYVVAALEAASTVAFAPAQPYNVSPTNLAFGTARVVGSTSTLITGIIGRETYAFVFKEGGIWNIDQNLNTVLLQTGMEKNPFFYNGRANLIHQQFVYYSWLHSLIRVYGSSHDDVGQDWSGKGLPEGREGYVSSLDSYTSLLIAAIDAGSTTSSAVRSSFGGISSVLGFDGIGWHELLRAYDRNLQIRMVKVQPCEGTRNRLWTDVGGDLVYQEMPLWKGSPRLDSGCRFQHEAVVESSAIDMGTASGLPKFVKELTIFSENLGNGNEIAVDYQTDDAVGSANWIEASTVYTSPEATAYLGLDNIRKFAYRLRIRSSNNTLPVNVLGVTPNGYARAPFKIVWTLRCRADNITSRGRLVKPDMLMRWLLDTARYPGRVQMLSQYELAHKFFVIVHPPRMFPYKPAMAGQAEESVFTLVLEEM